MKAIILNGSPRKNWNTAMMLREAQKGAESAGADTEYIDLYDLSYTGCRSCMACKRKGISEPCRCYWKDDLSPVIDSIYGADTLLIASPIYFSQPTGVFREFVERVCFPALSYNDYSSTFNDKVDVGVFLTMNVTHKHYEEFYGNVIEKQTAEAFGFLNGKVNFYPSCDTLQVNDYSKYDIGSFDELHKKEVRETVFQQELDRAYTIGKVGI